MNGSIRNQYWHLISAKQTRLTDCRCSLVVATRAVMLNANQIAITGSVTVEAAPSWRGPLVPTWTLATSTFRRSRERIASSPILWMFELTIDAVFVSFHSALAAFSIRRACVFPFMTDELLAVVEVPVGNLNGKIIWCISSRLVNPN
jgi:hypothetical protein